MLYLSLPHLQTECREVESLGEGTATGGRSPGARMTRSTDSELLLCGAPRLWGQSVTPAGVTLMHGAGAPADGPDLEDQRGTRDDAWVFGLNSWVLGKPSIDLTPQGIHSCCPALR